MGYDHGDSFPFDFEPNRIQFGSKSKGKLSPRPYPIQFEGKWNTSNLSVPLSLNGYTQQSWVSNRNLTLPFPGHYNCWNWEKKVT